MDPTKPSALERARRAKSAHEIKLLGMPNVVGVGIGQVRRGAKKTGEVGIVVMVNKKVPSAQLSEADLIPRVLDGVLVDVQEVGEFVASD